MSPCWLGVLGIHRSFFSLIRRCREQRAQQAPRGVDLSEHPHRGLDAGVRAPQQAPCGHVLSWTQPRNREADDLTLAPQSARDENVLCEASPRSPMDHALTQALLAALQEVRMETIEDLQRLTVSQELLQGVDEGRRVFRQPPQKEAPCAEGTTNATGCISAPRGAKAPSVEGAPLCAGSRRRQGGREGERGRKHLRARCH